MARIHVCPISDVESVARQSGARSMVTLLSPGVEVERPKSIAANRHLRLSMSDIDAPADGLVAPTQDHARALLEFVYSWDRAEPMLIHCAAAISRSPAAALIAICAMSPARDERDIAEELRCLSPMATPNKLVIRHGDALLSRRGRLIAAVNSIGRGEECSRGEPFVFDLERRTILWNRPIL